MNFYPVIADFCPLAPQDRFDLLYADPPWYYRDRRIVNEHTGKAKFGGGAMKHYPVIPDSIMVNRIAPMCRHMAADNAILLLWSVWPKMDFIIQEFIPAAGFRFRTEFMTWVKTKKDGKELIYGPGYYTASNSEVILLATRENRKPAYYFKPKITMMGSILLTPRKEHSRKPLLHDMIDRMYPQFSKIELFARACYPGWQAWGNQTNKYQVEKQSELIASRHSQ
jgi:N6-adenosine-specific RNA methylase IME4